MLAASSFDAGLSWSSPSAVNAGASSDATGDWAPQLATDTLGNWLAVWTSSGAPRTGTAAPDLDILATRSMDDGATWAGQAPVNTDASTDTSADFSASVATDNAGTWIAVWTSTESLGATIGDDDDIFYARSTDDGATWSAPAPLNTTAATDTATTPPESVSGVSGTATDVAAGYFHTCAIQAGTGDVVCWGDDEFGQSTPPDAVNGVSGTASTIAAGYYHNCAIQTGTDGVVCWGRNDSGQAVPPSSVDGVSGTASAIAGGASHSCAIQAGTGNVVCWGSNASGQATPPNTVNGISGTASAIAAGADHNCAVQAGTGNVVCWGEDSSGQATPPSSVNGASGTATDIAAGAVHSCAIQTGTGNLVCWFRDPNPSRALTQTIPPSDVDGTSGTASVIAARANYNCAIQAGTGRVVCWANNDFGQSNPPEAVNGGSGTASDIGVGAFHSCAIQAGTGIVVCWGQYGFGADSEPQVVTDGLGNWVVVWSSNNSLGDTVGRDRDIFVARSTNDGLTWTAPGPLNSNAATDSGSGNMIDVDGFPSLATDAQGVWIATWTGLNSLGDPKPPPPPNNREPTNDDVFFARSLDAGATWSTRGRLNTDGGTDLTTDRQSRVATDRAGNWVAVWSSLGTPLTSNGNDGDIQMARSTDDGVSWSAPAPLNTNATSDSGADVTPQVVFGMGSFVAVWSSKETLGGTLGPDADILLARSTDLGASWSPPAALNSTAATDEDDDRAPQLTTDGLGAWIAIWESGNPL